MSSSEKLPQESQIHTASAVLFGYHSNQTDKLYQMLKSPEILPDLNFIQAAFNEPHKCEIALALLSRGDSLEKFLDDIISLKTRYKIPYVIALVDSRQKEQFLPVQKRCLANKIVYFPLNISELAVLIRSQIKAPKPTQPSFSPPQPDFRATALIDPVFARKHHCVGLTLADSDLTVGLEDPMNLTLLDLLRDQTGKNIIPVAMTPAQLSPLLDKFYPPGTKQHFGGSAPTWPGGREPPRQHEFLPKGIDADIQAGISAKIMDILLAGIKDRATDFHILAGDNTFSLKYRIDGELKRVLTPQIDSGLAIANTLKMLAGMRLENKWVPQSGTITLKLTQYTLTLRASSVPTGNLEKIVLSVMEKESFEANLPALGLNKDQLTAMQKYLAAPYGMILVGGAREAGKSTSLYSMVKEIRSEPKNIVTIEEKSGETLPDCTQIILDPSKNLTSEMAIKGVLEQDADIIMVDPLRDRFTAATALQMALTGHQILAAVESDSPLHTLRYLKELGLSGLALASSLNLLVYQWSFPKNCPHCRDSFMPEEGVAALLKIPEKATVKRGLGCEACQGTGAKGHLVFYRVIPMSKDLRQWILEDIADSDISAKIPQLDPSSIQKEAREAVLKGDIAPGSILPLFQ